MPGKNIYASLQNSVRENFRENKSLHDLIKESANVTIQTPCIFLSHKSEDKEAVLELAQYIADSDLNYYLDIEDPNLQQAIKEKDHQRVTEFIQLGINNSTHLLTLVSEKTKDSWWVPFEIGFAKNGDIEVASIECDEILNTPSYLQITRKIKGFQSLETYISDVKKSTIKVSIEKPKPDAVEELLRIMKSPIINKGHPLINHFKF